MLNYLFRFALLFLLIPIQTNAQFEITGTVLDDETGEPLPAATIVIENSLKGTITNPEGHFSISVAELPITLLISYIGYERSSITIEDIQPAGITVRLKPSVTELEELVVTDRDPGLTIMEKVIERKKLWRADLQSYQADAYTRQVLQNDTSIVSISESSSVLYWNQNKGHREVQKSVRQTSNLSADQNFAGVRYLPNFYDDNIEIAGYNIVGITHPDALSFYHFSLLEILQMDGVPVYKIEVKPRRELQPTFEGVAYVLGRDYALIDVDLKPNDVVSFPPPVQDFNLSYKQQFSNYGSDFWFPVDMRIEGRIRIGMVGLQFPSIQFSQVSRISDYQVNISLPDSIFQDQTSLTQADTVSAAEAPTNEIPLTEEEKLAYETIDSTKTIEDAFRPEGFLARMVDDSDESEGSGFLSRFGEWMPAGIGIRGRYNRVEGVHLGLNYQKRAADIGLNTKFFSGYSFNTKDWDYGAEVEKRVVQFEDREITALLSYQNSTDTQYSSVVYSTGMNSFVTLLGGDDYFNYFRNEEVSAGLKFTNIIKRVDLEISGNHEVHRSFSAGDEIDFKLFSWQNIRRVNPEIEEGTNRSLSVNIGYNLQDRNFGFAGSRQIKMTAEMSRPEFGSDFDYSSIRMSVDWNFETFYRRRFFANTLDIHLSGGIVESSAPIQKLGVVDGSLSRFTPFSVLKTRAFLPYVGNKYGVISVEHNFRTIPFELLDLNYFVDNGWGIILFGGAGSAELNDNSSFLMMDTDGIHTEAGISLNGIFGILRLDFAKRLDSPGHFIGFSVPRYF
ncbi:DUF5686 and carboxypeptidase-like regulatory domain-containing protein [Rhodohalobacter sp.]|uniref:DUF5686 and carboxypeptidase-like regulatory domain-containing protein n=1 Tax=Rhodohalobacter sp. TaxID=1974210 RepID=UPI002ACDEAD0|nr:DUF5686 family protein [Rhodohalobacter sp.]MDZ7755658.1 DUF5686 family protein [Rhodohalobacter sp.]